MRIRGLGLMLDWIFCVFLCLLLVMAVQAAPVSVIPTESPPACLIGMTQCVLMEPVVAQAQTEIDEGPVDELISMFGKLELKTIIIYNFDDGDLCLAGAATYPVKSWGDITLNADALLISGKDGFTFGLGPGITIKNVTSMLDVTVAWSPQTRLNLGLGINY